MIRPHAQRVAQMQSQRDLSDVENLALSPEAFEHRLVQLQDQLETCQKTMEHEYDSGYIVDQSLLHATNIITQMQSLMCARGPSSEEPNSSRSCLQDAREGSADSRTRSNAVPPMEQDFSYDHTSTIESLEPLLAGCGDPNLLMQQHSQVVSISSSSSSSTSRSPTILPMTRIARVEPILEDLATENLSCPAVVSNEMDVVDFHSAAMEGRVLQPSVYETPSFNAQQLSLRRAFLDQESNDVVPSMTAVGFGSLTSDMASQWSRQHSQAWPSGVPMRPPLQPGLVVRIPSESIAQDDANTLTSSSTGPQHHSNPSDTDGYTLSIKNVPARFSKNDLFQLWPPEGSYNLLHLPFNHRTRRTTGHAIVNFLSRRDALQFCEIWDGEPLVPDIGAKGLRISASTTQGFTNNLELMLQNKTLMRMKNPCYLPALIQADGSLMDFWEFVENMQ